MHPRRPSSRGAAWDFIAREGGGLELAVVNPVGSFGQVFRVEGATKSSMSISLSTISTFDSSAAVKNSN